MRVLSFSDGLHIAPLFLYILLFAAVQLAVADVGGGKGYPATPWTKEGPKSILELEKAKALAATYQALSVSSESGDEERKPESITFEQVSLAPSHGSPPPVLVGYSLCSQRSGLSVSNDPIEVAEAGPNGDILCFYAFAK